MLENLKKHLSALCLILLLHLVIYPHISLQRSIIACIFWRFYDLKLQSLGPPEIVQEGRRHVPDPHVELSIQPGLLVN